MKSDWLDGSFLRTIVYGLVAAGIIHICATFATPYVLGSGAYERLVAELPANKLVVLGPPSPQAQFLPFQDPHTHYAFCHYDATEMPVLIKATLPASGWTLALYSPGGDNFYVVTGSDQKVTEVSAVLVPPGDRYLDLLPEQLRAANVAARQAVLPELGPRGRARRASEQATPSTIAQVDVPAPQGILVIRAPVKGQGYRPTIEAALARASCARLPSPAATPSQPAATQSPRSPGPLSGTPRPGL